MILTLDGMSMSIRPLPRLRQPRPLPQQRPRRHFRLMLPLVLRPGMRFIMLEILLALLTQEITAQTQLRGYGTIGMAPLMYLLAILEQLIVLAAIPIRARQMIWVAVFGAITTQYNSLTEPDRQIHKTMLILDGTWTYSSNLRLYIWKKGFQ